MDSLSTVQINPQANVIANIICDLLLLCDTRCLKCRHVLPRDRTRAQTQKKTMGSWQIFPPFSGTRTSFTASLSNRWSRKFYRLNACTQPGLAKITKFTNHKKHFFAVIFWLLFKNTKSEMAAKKSKNSFYFVFMCIGNSLNLFKTLFCVH